jgi:hypothetical protein
MENGNFVEMPWATGKKTRSAAIITIPEKSFAARTYSLRCEALSKMIPPTGSERSLQGMDLRSRPDL